MSRSWYASVIGTCILLWAAHSAYLNRLFENVRFFSHLADFEREMAYRTEMGLYFSYYKMIVSSTTFYEGLHAIMQDNVTEFGHTINTLQRFNLYPEVILAGAFRTFKQVARVLDWKTEFCWQVSRADNLSPVQSCEGIGNLHYFYIYGVFGLAGSVVASIFLCGVILSNSYFGGVLSSAAFLFNHGEATRVAWTPPLRESFAYPVFMAQVVLLSHILKSQSTSRLKMTIFIALTTTFILFWQLSQFVFATQLGAVFVAFALDKVSPRLFFSLWKSYTASFAISLALLFGNPMLLSSLFSTSLVAYLVVILLERVLRRILTFRPLFFTLLANVYLACVFGGKYATTRLFDIRDDNHVAELLRSKFSDDFATFHTRLYTCAPEFDFISAEWFTKLSETLLLPTVGVSLVLILVQFCRHQLFTASFWWRSSPTDDPTKSSIKAEVIYNVIQAACFAVMAILIMRLKLFATPHLCILTAIVSNKSMLLSSLGARLTNLRIPLIVALLACMALKGHKNVTEQLEMRGEYNNPEQEQLFEWIMQDTPSDAVFAGTMPVMANVKLSTLRPIVNHPHYENEEVRNRTLIVYSMYSRKSILEVHKALIEMKVDYYIFQQSSCIGSHPDLRCTYLAMWDLHDPANRDQPSLCQEIVDAASENPSAVKKISPFFQVVYNSPAYVVLRVIR